MDVLEFLFELLPPWLATAIVGVVSFVAGIIGSTWHAHEARQLAVCNSPSGVLGQAFNASMSVNCGSASIMSKIAAVLQWGGWIAFVLAIIGFALLARFGKLRSLEH